MPGIAHSSRNLGHRAALLGYHGYRDQFIYQESVWPRGVALTRVPVESTVRYEPDERPPLLISIGVGAQITMLFVAPMVVTVGLVFRIAEQPAEYLVWGAYVALLISGAGTLLQAVRVWRIGAGHLLFMGTNVAFLPVCVQALTQAGPATMASLIVVSSLFQFALAARLALFRRIFTPVVSGTVIMLIAATVMPAVFALAMEAPEGSSDSAAPATALVTIAISVALMLGTPPMLRLWAPILGIGVGCAAAGALGLFDTRSILDAAWVGVPMGTWPGLNITLGVDFWALLPSFIIVTLVGGIETIGDGVGIQRVSYHRERATDFRVVQGALKADGVRNMLSGLAGTLPNTTYSSSISLVQIIRSVHRDSRPGIRCVHNACPRNPLRARHECHHWRRIGFPEIHSGGNGVLAGIGVSKSMDIPRLAGRWLRGRAGEQRHDLRRFSGNSDDAVH